MPEWIYAVIGFIALTVIFTLISIRQRNASWQGTVTKIAPYSYDDSDNRHHEGVKIFYKTDAGKKGKLDINTFAYNQSFADLEVGSRLIKEKGEYFPKKVV